MKKLLLLSVMMLIASQMIFAQDAETGHTAVSSVLTSHKAISQTGLLVDKTTSMVWEHLSIILIISKASRNGITPWTWH